MSQKKPADSSRQVTMTRAQLQATIDAFGRAVRALPPPLLPIALAKQLSSFVIKPCDCGQPECASVPLLALVNAARDYEAHQARYGGLPGIITFPHVPPGRA